MIKQLHQSLIVTVCISFASAVYGQDVVIDIDPSVSTSIAGHLNLEREKFFNLSHGGVNFESTINNTTRSDNYFKTLKMNFGRSLGMVNSAVKWGNNVREDAARPGYVDMAYLQSKSAPSVGTFSADFGRAFPGNLGVAFHENHNAYPTFMPQVTTTLAGTDGNLPTNTAAAAELAVGLLKYNYTNWTRPATYELINEPHYSLDKTLLADLHTAVWQKAKDEGVSTLIGGPCSSTAYYYKAKYSSFSGLSDFINNTKGKLDFYSFHVYDYLGYNADANDFTGRVSSGLPIEGVLDLVPNYTIINYGKEVPMVISEHGGYISKTEEADLDFLANKYFPGSGFTYEMKRRSISNYIMVSSAIANTMAFMNHPHTILKAVPFILLESFAWDPKYYSSLLVANNFTDKTNWQESQLIHFYQFFKGVQGRRVKSLTKSLDVQHHAFVDGNKLIIVLNNLANKVEPLKLNLPTTDVSEISVRRLGRNTDFTPYLTEGVVSTVDGLQLLGREAMVITVTYNSAINQALLVDEKPLYGTSCAKTFPFSSNTYVYVDHIDSIDYAYMRVGVSRAGGINKVMNFKLNNKTISVPAEDCVGRIDDGSDYASTKIIPFDKSLLVKGRNTLNVEFPDNNSGGIGAVVFRIGYIQNTTAMASVQPKPVLTRVAGSANIWKVSVGGSAKSVSMKVFDMQGKSVYNQKSANTGMLELNLGSAINKGVYILKIQTEKGSFSEKIMVI